MSDTLFQTIVVAIILVLIVGLLASTRRRPKRVPAVVIIKEGRFPGEPTDGIVCPNCGRKFRHTQTFEYELVKCPYCGSEVS